MCVCVYLILRVCVCVCLCVFVSLCTLSGKPWAPWEPTSRELSYQPGTDQKPSTQPVEIPKNGSSLTEKHWATRIFNLM